jgi:putative alpha-1,2-mannosidase
MSRIAFFTICLLVFKHLAAQEIDYNQYVYPLIGTSRMGHTYSGATVPFGMAQLSPETDILQYELNDRYNEDVYKYRAGYQYNDPPISFDTQV